MQRSQIIKAMFWELRAAGIPGSARDVLRLAHMLLLSHKGELGRADDFGRIVDSRVLPLLPVDVIMADGGWQVLEFENSRAIHHDPDAFDRYRYNSRIEGLVGRLWLQSIPQD